MFVYILTIHQHYDDDDYYIYGVYANQSDAETEGKRLVKKRRWTYYTVEEEIVLGYKD
jgi:hypothetical protein